VVIKLLLLLLLLLFQKKEIFAKNRFKLLLIGLPIIHLKTGPGIRWKLKTKLYFPIIIPNLNTTVSEFQTRLNRAQIPKKRFQVTAGLYLEKLDIILSGTNRI